MKVNVFKFNATRFSTIIWISLCALTITTFSIGETGMAGKGVMLTLLTIAFIKGQIVANYFMDLRHAGWFWRGIVLAYFLVVGVMIAIAYLIGLH